MNGRRVQHKILSAAHINGSEEWELMWADPEDEGADLQVELVSLYGAYYGEVLEILEIQEETAQPPTNGFLVPLTNTGAWIGLHRKVLAALEDGNWDALLTFSESMFQTDSYALGYIDQFGVANFADGIMIAFEGNGGKRSS